MQMCSSVNIQEAVVISFIMLYNLPMQRRAFISVFRKGLIPVPATPSRQVQYRVMFIRKKHVFAGL